MNPGSPAVVVTRPARDADSLCRRLRSSGRDTIACPAFSLRPEPEPRRRSALAGLADCDVAIVTSPFAAGLAASDAPAPRDGPIYVAPGRGTAAVLTSAGLPASHPEAGGTSEDLLALPVLGSVRGRRVAILGAPGGRRLLDRELAARGASVERIHLYRREPLPVAGELVDALASARPLIVMVSSRNAFEHITRALPSALRPAWLAATFVVSSARLARLCRDRGARDVRQAEGASDAAMLRALDEAR